MVYHFHELMNLENFWVNRLTALYWGYNCWKEKEDKGTLDCSNICNNIILCWNKIVDNLPQASLCLVETFGVIFSYLSIFFL